MLSIGLFVRTERKVDWQAITLMLTGGDIRVTLLEDDAYEITDYTMPLNPRNKKIVFKQDMPKHLLDGVSVLSICENGEYIEGIGKKYTDTVFYLESKNDNDQ
jgi:hypothetical protein